MKVHANSSFLLLLSVLALVGCQVLPPEEEVPVVDLLPPPKVMPSTRDWLEVRAVLCRQGVPEQRARMMELAVAGKSFEEQMERLLLASCQPERTPGLLREALAQVDERHASESELALISLLRDHARSYRVLEEKNKQLAEQLEATISGIREIETEVDALRPLRAP